MDREQAKIDEEFKRITGPLDPTIKRPRRHFCRFNYGPWLTNYSSLDGHIISQRRFCLVCRRAQERDVY